MQEAGDLISWATCLLSSVRTQVQIPSPKCCWTRKIFGNHHVQEAELGFLEQSGVQTSQPGKFCVQKLSSPYVCMYVHPFVHTYFKHAHMQTYHTRVQKKYVKIVKRNLCFLISERYKNYKYVSKPKNQNSMNQLTEFMRMVVKYNNNNKW